MAKKLLLPFYLFIFTPLYLGYILFYTPSSWNVEKLIRMPIKEAREVLGKENASFETKEFIGWRRTYLFGIKYMNFLFLTNSEKPYFDSPPNGIDIHYRIGTQSILLLERIVSFDKNGRKETTWQMPTTLRNSMSAGVFPGALMLSVLPISLIAFFSLVFGMFLTKTTRKIAVKVWLAGVSSAFVIAVLFSLLGAEQAKTGEVIFAYAALIAAFPASIFIPVVMSLSEPCTDQGFVLRLVIAWVACLSVGFLQFWIVSGLCDRFRRTGPSR